MVKLFYYTGTNNICFRLGPWSCDKLTRLIESCCSLAWDKIAARFDAGNTSCCWESPGREELVLPLLTASWKQKMPRVFRISPGVPLLPETDGSSSAETRLSGTHSAFAPCFYPEYHVVQWVHTFSVWGIQGGRCDFIINPNRSQWLLGGAAEPPHAAAQGDGRYCSRKCAKLEVTLA